MDMNIYIDILLRTVFLYILVLIVFRLMGKREVGELSIMDLVVFVLIAECVAFSLDDMDKPIFETIFPIIVLLAIQYLNSLLSLKSKKVRDMIDGDPSLIVRDGVINEIEMRKQRYNLDDLFQQLREERIPSVKDIAYAYLEPSGKLSIFLKDDDPLVLPLIIDGDVIEKHLTMIDKDKSWFYETLKSKGYTNPDDIFYCCYEDFDLHIQLKEKARNEK
nr:DUF421 domain-containing protein [Lysinibacillus timonensis]